MLTTSIGIANAHHPTLFSLERTGQNLSSSARIKIDQTEMNIISLVKEGNLIAAGMIYGSAPTNISPIESSNNETTMQVKACADSTKIWAWN